MRAKKKFKGRVAEEQCGFTEDKGTRNAIFILRMLSERMIDVQRDIYVCFIDYQKAFDNVRHEELFELLKGIGMDGKDWRLLRHLYWNQSAALRVGGELSGWVQIEKDVRQGCVMSPDLYNIYSEAIMDSIRGKEVISVGGVNINNKGMRMTPPC